MDKSGRGPKRPPIIGYDPVFSTNASWNIHVPMPNSIFFNGNIAIHGTEAEWLLGKPASHGCIRLSKANAKTLYDVVKANGKSKASVCVEGKTPAQ